MITVHKSTQLKHRLQGEALIHFNLGMQMLLEKGCKDKGYYHSLSCQTLESCS